MLDPVGAPFRGEGERDGQPPEARPCFRRSSRGVVAHTCSFCEGLVLHLLLGRNGLTAQRPGSATQPPAIQPPAKNPLLPVGVRSPSMLKGALHRYHSQKDQKRRSFFELLRGFTINIVQTFSEHVLNPMKPMKGGPTSRAPTVIRQWPEASWAALPQPLKHGKSAQVNVGGGDFAVQWKLDEIRNGSKKIKHTHKTECICPQFRTYGNHWVRVAVDMSFWPCPRLQVQVE